MSQFGPRIPKKRCQLVSRAVLLSRYAMRVYHSGRMWNSPLSSFFCPARWTMMMLWALTGHLRLIASWFPTWWSKMADINGPAKPKDLHKQWTYRISEEFYEQVLSKDTKESVLALLMLIYKIKCCSALCILSHPVVFTGWWGGEPRPANFSLHGQEASTASQTAGVIHQSPGGTTV